MNINPISKKETIWKMQTPLSNGRKLTLEHTARNVKLFVTNADNRILEATGFHKTNGKFLGEIFDLLKKFQNDTIGETNLLQEFIKSRPMK